MSATAVASYGALLATVALNIFTIKRRIRSWHRKSGQRFSETMSDAERAIKTDAEPASVQLLDRALRSLVADARRKSNGEKSALPPVAAARISGTSIELVLAEPTRPIAPFVAASERTWRLSAESCALLPADQAHETEAPYPAMVTIGADADNAHVLLNLESTKVLGLHGDTGPICEVLIAIAMEAATSPWADRVVVDCVGFGVELPQLLATGRLCHWDGIDQFVADMLARVEGVLPFAEGAGMDALDVQCRHDLEPSPPDILLSALPLELSQAVTIGKLLSGAKPRLRSIAAVIAAVPDDDPTEQHLDATPGRTVRLPGLNRAIMLQRVTSEQYQQLMGRPNIAAEISGCEPEERDKNSLVEPAAIDDYEETVGADPLDPASLPGQPAIVVRVLGPVEIVGRDVALIGSGKRNLILELAAYLRLNPGRTGDDVSRALGGPRGPWASATRSSNLSRLRAWLGRDEHGKNYVPAITDGRLYRLSDGVGCDWDDFRCLARRGLSDITETGTDMLRRAMALVRGEPFAGVSPRSYIWAEFARQEMISVITDVAHELAVRLTQAGKPAAARAVIARGLEVEPGSELLYCDLFRAEYRAGNAAGIEEAAKRLLVTLRELDLDMGAETAALLSGLRSRSRPAVWKAS